MRYAGKVNQLAIMRGFTVAKPGVKLYEINEAVEKCIIEYGCTPAFKDYQPTGALIPFPATACISPNDVAVHGIPGDYTIRNGDLLTIDVGTRYKGWFVDAARSRVIKESIDTKATEATRLIEATEHVLWAQIGVIKDKCTLLEMVEAAERAAADVGVTVMPQWGGHQIGDKVHLDPFIPSAIDKSQSPLKQKLDIKKYSRQYLEEGQTICIEPVTTFGSGVITIDGDMWTVRTADGRLAAHSERCLLVTKNGYEIIS